MEDPLELPWETVSLDPLRAVGFPRLGFLNYGASLCNWLWFNSSGART
jgi:hypothetical protein